MQSGSMNGLESPTLSASATDNLSSSDEQSTSSSPMNSKRARESSLDSHPDQWSSNKSVGSDIDDQLDAMLEAGSSAQNVAAMSPADQLRFMEELENRAMVEGDTWYIIGNAWYRRFKQYCHRMNSDVEATRKLGETMPPGPVSNASILQNNTLLPDLMPGDQVSLLPEEGWNRLVDWYGLSSKAIPRQIISEGKGAEQSTLVEMYPFSYTIYLVASRVVAGLERCPTFTMSRKSTIREFKEAIRNSLDLQPDQEFQLWTLDDEERDLKVPYLSMTSLMQSTKVDLDKDDHTLAYLALASQDLAVELRAEKSGVFLSDNMTRLSTRQTSGSPSTSSPSSAYASGFSRLTTSTNSPSYMSNDSGSSVPSWMQKSATDTRPKGACGLVNLINTCFMNSALQCLSNTPKLSQFFLTGDYTKDLNRDNPLGKEGKIADAYADLIGKLWSGTATVVAPRDFKEVIGEFNRTFAGFQQQDSQELLAFLLDGLHEDLNRVLKKPYIEIPDFDDMPDEEIASKCWQYYKARNDSIIVDLFHGQFKSKLVCNECGKVSVIFDPLMYLSLPLPEKQKNKYSFVYIPYDPSQLPMHMTLRLTGNTTIKQFRAEVAKAADVEDPNTLLVAEMFSNAFYSIYADTDFVGSINEGDTIFVYQLPYPLPTMATEPNRYAFRRSRRLTAKRETPADGNEPIIFPVYCAVETEDQKLKNFGHPMLLAIRPEDAKQPDNLYQLIVEHLERYALVKLFEETRVPQPATEPTSMSQSPETPKSESPDTMDIDDIQVQSPVDTAAAVTAAGGKHMVPLKRLFSMNVIEEENGPDEFIPTGLFSWNMNLFTDIKDRWEKALAKQEEPKPEVVAATTGSDMVSAPESLASSTASLSTEAKMPESNTTDIDEDQDPFEDEPPAVVSTEEITTLSPMISDGPSSSTARSDKDTQGLPLGAVIRQGEAVILVWRTSMAQQVFGTPKQDDTIAAQTSLVSDAAWKDIRYMPDSQGDVDDANREYSLSHCMDEFTKEEQLDGDNLWYCPRCKKHQQASKTMSLWSLPDILVVHLKRFYSIGSIRNKINTAVEFPLEGLDLTDRIVSVQDPESLTADEDRYIYDLYAVDNHYGTLAGGHYTAYAKNNQDNEWYEFNDSNVLKINADQVKSNAAYLLFYKRRRAYDMDVQDDSVVNEQSAADEPSSTTNTTTSTLSS